MTLDEFFAEAERLNLRVLGTPEETRAALDLKDAEIAALRAEVAGLREFVEHVRRNGGTHLANMAIAVLAARKGEA